MAKDQKKELISNNLRQAKILVVDDKDDQWLIIKKAVQTCLPKVGFERTASAEQTVKLLQEWLQQEHEVPRLILLDLYLPDRSQGWNLLAQIKGLDPVFRRIPVIMLSVSVEPADIHEAHERGVNSYLAKPIDYADWITLFDQIRNYWWETVTLPPLRREGL